MRPSAFVAVLVSVSAIAAGCADLDEEGVSTTPPEAVDAVAVVFAPAEQVSSCVEQIKFGAFSGDPVWTQLWNDVGQSDDGAAAYCTQLGVDNPGELARVHEGWLQVETFLAAAEAAPPSSAAPTPDPAPATTERAPDIPPSGPDLNCPEIGRRVWVGANDYHDLDNNGDGWGCDSYG